MIVLKGDKDVHWRKMDNISVAVGMMNKIMEDNRRGVRNMPIRGENARSKVAKSSSSLSDKDAKEEKIEDRDGTNSHSDVDRMKSIPSWTTAP